MIDVLGFARVGPGLTFVSLEALTLRLQAIGVGDQETAMGVVAALGLGSVRTPDGIELFHWEGLCLRLMEVLGRNQRVEVLAAQPCKKGNVNDRVRVTTDQVWDSTYTGSTEAALLCLLLDEAFEQGKLPPQRALETARLIRETLDVAARTRYGLGQCAGESGTEPGPEPGAADAQ